MNEIVVTIEDAARSLPDLVERIRLKGEAAVLVSSGQPLARIVPALPGAQGAEDLLAFLRQWRILYPEPDDEFAEAIEASRAAVQPPRDPWE